MNETLLAMIRQNTRQPVESEGDVYSLAACNDIGCVRLVEMMDEFDLDSLDALGDYICDTSEKAVRDNIGKLPNGEYKNTMTIDGVGDPIDLVATLTIHDDKITVDYDGTSPKSPKGINVPMAYTTAYTCFGLSCIVSGDIPNNAGSLAPFEISAPEGTILNAPYPAPVCSRHVIGQMLPDVSFGCLAQAAPDRVPAEGASCLWNITMRGATDRAANDSKLFTITAVTNGGTGARPIKDGLSATAYPSGVRGTPVEINETVAPIIFHRKEFRPDSGGAGTHRGGLGQILEIESAIGADFELLAAYDRIDFPARGRNGGGNGEAGSLSFTSGEKLLGKGTQTIPAGKIARFHTPGGAGFGDPKDRNPDQLACDVENGLITPEAAAREYGYVAGGDD
jgi:N-methylhydantoinase B